MVGLQPVTIVCDRVESRFESGERRTERRGAARMSRARARVWRTEELSLIVVTGLVPVTSLREAVRP